MWTLLETISGSLLDTAKIFLSSDIVDVTCEETKEVLFFPHHPYFFLLLYVKILKHFMNPVIFR